MNFGAAMTLQDRLKFSEGSKLAPMRDERNNSLLWKKIRNDSQQQYATVDNLQKVIREMGRTRRKPMTPAIQQQQDIFPFKTYNIQNASATAAQRKVYADAGLNTDDFTFQVRGGSITARVYNPVGGISGGGYGNNNTPYLFSGTDTPTYADRALLADFFKPEYPNTNAGIYLPNATDTLISDTSFDAPNQIMVNAQVNGYGESFASVWATFGSDPLSFAPAVYARMFDYGGLYGRQTEPFPFGQLIFPIAIFGTATNGTAAVPFVQQIQTGNLTLIYQRDVQTFRGKWSAVNGQIFYYGDVVIEDTIAQTQNVSGGGGGTISYYRVFQYINPAGAAVESATPVAGANWTAIGSLLT